MKIWTLLLSLSQAPTPPSGTEPQTLVDRLEALPTAQLEACATHSTGLERGLAHLFLGADDTSRNASLEIALASFDSLHRAEPTPWNAALLGTAEALQARRHRRDVIEATRWVGKAIAHFDQAIAGDSANPSLRIFRIHSLVEVPEIFHVDERLRRDEALLRRGSPRLVDASASSLLALAALDYRFGKLDEASAIWKLVAGKSVFAAKPREQARRKLESLRG